MNGGKPDITCLGGDSAIVWRRTIPWDQSIEIGEAADGVKATSAIGLCSFPIDFITVYGTIL
jgi:hypothetical protein